MLTGGSFELVDQFDWATALMTLREEEFSLDGISYQEIKQALLGVLPTALRIRLGVS
jgi:hypothetical protein